MLDLFKKLIISFYYRSKIERLVYYFNFYITRNIKKTYLYNFILSPFKYYFVQKDSIYLKKLKKDLSISLPSTNDGYVLVQMVEDYAYGIEAYALASAISKKHNLQVNLYNINWMKQIGWTDRYEQVYNFFYSTKLKRFYKSFGKSVVFDCNIKHKNSNKVNLEFLKIKKGLQTPEQLLKLEVEGILIGDLIYDTYLRYFAKPTINEINDDILLITEISINIFFEFKSLILKKEVKSLIIGFTAYIHSGIPARLCLEHGIKVYTIGKNNYLFKEITKEFPYHILDYTNFSFIKNISNENFYISKENLEKRFNGQIDHATFYMKSSSYSQKGVNDLELEQLFKKKSRNVVIYAQDFYDSPHVTRGLLFNDFYKYLESILTSINNIKSNHTSYFVKVHPNGMGDSKELTKQMVSRFRNENFHIIDTSISNLTIVSLRPDLVCTYDGSIGLEMAYFKIKTIALYDNPYVNFNFVHTCYSTNEYIKIMSGELTVDLKYDINEVYSFYYQYFIENNVMYKYKEIADFIKHSIINDSYTEEYLKSFYNHNYNLCIPLIKSIFEESYNNISLN